MNDRKRKYPPPSQNHGGVSAQSRGRGGDAGRGVQSASRASSHPPPSSSSGNTNGNRSRREHHNHNRGGRGNNSQQHVQSGINSLIEEGLRLQRERAAHSQPSTTTTNNEGEELPSKLKESPMMVKTIVSPAFAANGHMSILQSQYLSSLYGDRVGRFLQVSRLHNNTCHDNANKCHNDNNNRHIRRNNAERLIPYCKAVQGNDPFLRDHWAALLSKPCRSHRLHHAYADLLQRGDCFCLLSLDRIQLQRQDQIAYATSNTIGSQRPFHFTSASWSGASADYAMAALLEYSADEQGIALMSPHYQSSTVGGTMLLHWRSSATKDPLASILWGCRNGGPSGSYLCAVGENQIHRVDLETASSLHLYTGLPEKPVASSSSSARHSYKNSAKVTFFGSIQECIHAELCVCSNPQDVLLVGGRNGVVGLLDTRSKQPPSSVAKMSFGVHYMQCVSSRGYSVLAQDITNHVAMYDVRRASKEGIRVHKPASSSSSSSSTPRFNPCRFWLADDEELLLAVSSDPKDSSVECQYYSLRGSVEQLGDAVSLSPQQDVSGTTGSQANRATMSSFAPSPYSNLAVPTSRNLSFAKHTRSPDRDCTSTVWALLKEKYVDSVEQQLYTWKYPSRYPMLYLFV